MNKKKFYKILIVVILIAPMLFLGFRYVTRIRNVFDEIYYDLNVYNNWFHGRTFSHSLPQIEGFDYWPWDMGGEAADGFYSIRYLIHENQNLSIVFHLDKEELEFNFRIDFPETNERIHMNYLYSLSSKVLLRRSIRIFSSLYRDDDFPTQIINEDDIQDFLERHYLTMEELQHLYHWFLFDRILVDWFDISTRFSSNHLGRFTFIDETN